MFSYMPLIPCLRTLVLNHTYATCLQYCADKYAKTRMCTPGMTTDIFDRLHYRSLLGECVIVRDQTLTHHYFSDHCNIALGFATNGFAPFKKQKHTTWILLVFNYNLPPDEHFQRDNILCVGIILYLVQKSHGMQTCLSIHLCKNCSSLQSVCPHMMPSQAATLPSMPILSQPLVISLLFP